MQGEGELNIPPSNQVFISIKALQGNEGTMLRLMELECRTSASKNGSHYVLPAPARSISKNMYFGGRPYTASYRIAGNFRQG